MRTQCTDCNKKFRNQGALDMHTRAKHPKQLQARIHAATLPVRKNRRHSLFVGFIGGFIGAISLLVIATVIAVQSRALELSPTGAVVTLKPWIVTVHKR
jgi:hypothetical protein